MKQIDSELFVRLMQMEGEGDELWFTDDCVVSDEGVESTLPNSSFSTDADNRQTRSLLTKGERMVIDEVAEGLELTLPCNYKEFREWVVRNDFDDVLIEADALFYDRYADEEDRQLFLLINEGEEKDCKAMTENGYAERVTPLLGDVSSNKEQSTSNPEKNAKLVDTNGVSYVEESNVSQFKKWLYQTWIKHDCPKARLFFQILKEYEGKEGSPIISRVTTVGSESFKFKTERMKEVKLWTIKTLTNNVTEFKKKKNIQNAVNT